MLNSRSTTAFDESRCACADAPNPGGVTECSQGWSPDVHRDATPGQRRPQTPQAPAGAMDPFSRAPDPKFLGFHAFLRSDLP